jgi:hypothetical protein
MPDMPKRAESSYLCRNYGHILCSHSGSLGAWSRKLMTQSVSGMERGFELRVVGAATFELLIAAGMEFKVT